MRRISLHAISRLMGGKGRAHPNLLERIARQAGIRVYSADGVRRIHGDDVGCLWISLCLWRGRAKRPRRAKRSQPEV